MRLGATPTLCISLVAEAISAFHAAHPGVELHLTESGSRRLVDQLAVGAVDIALITTSDGPPPSALQPSRRRCSSRSSSSSPSAAAAAGRRRRRDQPRATVATLPQIAFDESYDLRATTDAAFRAAGLDPDVVLEGAEMDAVLRFVERGLGVAVVPAMVLLDRPGLRSVRLAHPPWSRTISLGRPPTSRRRPRWG